MIKIYAMYLDEIRQEQVGLDETDLMYKQLYFLINRSNELERKTIPESPTRDDRLYHEIELDAVRYNIEQLTKQGLKKELIENDNVRFQYYPEYSDIDFNKYVYGKKEFNKNKIPLITPQYIKERESHGFEKSPTQKFVKNFISRINGIAHNDRTNDNLVARYFNTTSAINAIQFKISSGNIDSGDICLYGIL